MPYPPRVKLSRRLGGPVFPTQHPAIQGTSRPQRGSPAPNSYRAQLEARRVLKALYGFLPAGPLVQAARAHRGNTLALLRGLERRLDVLVYRANWAQTLREARHTIARGGLLVNGAVCLKPGLQLRPGDVFQIHPNWMPFLVSRLQTNLKESSERFLQHRPPHLEINYTTLQAILVFSPQEVRYPVALSWQALRWR